MKKFLLILFVLFTTKLYYAQAADTVLVPTVYKGSPLGAINRFILGDTTADGKRKNVNRFYKLKRDSIYFLNGTLTAKFPLRIIADKPTARSKPAIIAQGVLADGKSLVVFIQCNDDGYFRNIYFQTAQPTGIGESTITVQAFKNNGVYQFDGCYFEWGLFLTVGVYAKDTKLKFEDCYVRNVQNTTSVWNGRGISFQNNPVDTVIIRNNTFFDMNSWFLQGQTGPIKYALVDHNTIVNTVKWPIHWQRITNAVFSNNLFYNVHSYGETAADKAGQDVDGLNFGIFNLFPLDASFTIKEADRKIKLHNNNWYYSIVIKDYWKTEKLENNPFMNTRTQDMFTNKTKWPLLSEKNTTNLDPLFDNEGNGASQMVDWMLKMRAALPTSWWGWDPDKDRFGVQWPLPEKLTYKNTTLLKGADGGFPIGDLNWYPEEKAKWLKWLLTSVEKDESILPTEFVLAQNYPNPFNPETVISFAIPTHGNVSLEVYDVLGRKVSTLVNEKMTPGNYNVIWNGKDYNGNSLASGVYIYKLSTDKYSLTKKMMLLK